MMVQLRCWWWYRWYVDDGTVEMLMMVHLRCWWWCSWDVDDGTVEMLMMVQLRCWWWYSWDVDDGTVEMLMMVQLRCWWRYSWDVDDGTVEMLMTVQMICWWRYRWYVDDGAGWTAAGPWAGEPDEPGLGRGARDHWPSLLPPHSVPTVGQEGNQQVKGTSSRDPGMFIFYWSCIWMSTTDVEKPSR